MTEQELMVRKQYSKDDIQRIYNFFIVERDRYNGENNESVKDRIEDVVRTFVENNLDRSLYCFLSDTKPGEFRRDDFLTHWFFKSDLNEIIEKLKCVLNNK